jgi:hypothetical protein
MNQALKRSSLLLATLLLLLPALPAPEPALAQTTITRDLTIIPASVLFTPEMREALHECVGEYVNFTEGFFRLRAQYTALPNGITRVGFHGAHQGVSGTGETTGATYHFTGGGVAITYELPLEQVPFQVSWVEHGRIVGPTDTPNVRFDTHWHLTINANGEVTADFNFQRSVCQ